MVDYRIYSSRRSSYKPSQAFLGSIFTKKILYSNNLINSVRLFVKVQVFIIAPIYGQTSVFKNHNRIFLFFFLVRQVCLSFFPSVSAVFSALKESIILYSNNLIYPVSPFHTCDDLILKLSYTRINTVRDHTEISDHTFKKKS